MRAAGSEISGGNMTDSRITDVWFRSVLPLTRIAALLGLADVSQDAENRWEWVIGTLNGMQFDITRDHTEARFRVDTRIFLLDDGQFTDDLLAIIGSRLSSVVRGTIKVGRWEYRSRDDWDRIVVSTIKRPAPQC